MSLYQNGKALREEGKQVEAMQAFIEAAHSETEDEALLGRVYSNMANMCRQANDHETAYEVYEMSAAHFKKTDDSLAGCGFGDCCGGADLGFSEITN